MTLGQGATDAITTAPRNDAERIAPAQKHHFRELDSLRGLASLAVVFYHWTSLFPSASVPRWLQLVLITTPLQLLTRGHTAVVLFFVLSGFVLSLPQVRGNKVHYPSYLVKRICRIYLPYAAALVFALLGCWKFHGLNAYDDWFQRTWHEAPKLSVVVQHFFLIGDYANDTYNTAFWSLVQEMRISLFFPVLCWFVIRFRLIGASLLVVALFSFEIFAQHHGLLPYEGLRTVIGVADFIAGILLALYLPKLRPWLSDLDRRVYWSLFALSLALFIYTPWVAYHAHVQTLAVDGGIAAGGTGIILFSLVDRSVSRLILGPAISFLGRISFSLYLLHGTILFVFAYLAHGRLSLFEWLLPYLCVSILGATLMYRWVELPSISLGKALAKRLHPPIVASSELRAEAIARLSDTASGDGESRKLMD